ncbi:MAG: response regulator [Spirochaetia bacterium]
MPSGRQFQVIFDYSPIGMMIMDTASRLLYVNRSVLELFKTGKSELEGSPLTGMIVAKDRKRLMEKLRVLPEQNTAEPFTLRYQNGDGDFGWCRLNAAYVGDGEVSPFIFAAVEDITDQKLGVERLVKEKEDAQRATRTKSAFLANMSHEIRTPIHTIIGMMELLLQTKLDEEQREYGEQVQFSAEALLSLINDILDFSKIEAGKLVIENIEFDPVSMIENAVDMVCLEAHKKGLEVIVSLSPSLPEKVKGDPTRLRQVIVNLLSNAVKFTREGRITVSGGLPERSKLSGTLFVEVKDTGIGIPGEKKKSLFKAFSQLDSSTTRKFGGSGLGLSICRNLIGLMGGTIGVESGEGKGSVFYFDVPVQIVTESEKVQPIDKSRAILVADRSGPVRSILSKYLSERYSRIDTAGFGSEVIRMMKEAASRGRHYDAVLIGLLLEDMDGWQLAGEINADTRINDSRLILMSPAGKQAGEAKMKLLKWFDGYLTKPVKRTQLFSTLEGVFENVIDLLPVEEEEDREGAVEEGGADPFAGYSVLVAEDHQVNRELFKTILEHHSINVKLAADGREAVDTVRNDGELDLIFMDVQMPELNGYEAVEMIRKEGYRTPVIAVTASAVQGEREKCSRAGMNDFLTKPFREKDLLSMLERWLGDAGDSGSGAGKETESGDNRIFDYQRALETFMNKQDVLFGVIQKFIRKTADQLKDIEQKTKMGDLEGAKITAHGIKGGALNLEARSLAQAAYGVEAAAVSGNGDKILKSLLPDLSGKFDEFRIVWENGKY